MARRKTVYTIDDIRVDVGSERVFKAGRVLSLEPKAFKLLIFLIENRQRLIEKQELLDAIWSEAFVTENAMTRVVAQLRKTLGDEAKEARYIQTVPTRGYRFIGDVRIENDEFEKGADRRSPRLVAYGSVALVGATALSTLLFLGRRTDRSSPHKGNLLSPAQVTSSLGLDAFAALSPDGSAIAYSSNRSGSFEIYVKQLTPGGAEIQLTSDGGHNLQPAWSPDGRQIAYYSMRQSGLWLVPSFGGVVRRLTDFGSRPAWSPDGRWIAFQSYGFTDFGVAAYEAMPPSTIWICSSEQGAPSSVTKPGEPPGGHGAPSWSPDGERIVLTSFDYGSTQAWSVSRKGGDAKRLLADLPFFILDALYAPNGALYLTAVTGGQYGLWRVPALTPSGGPAGEPVLLGSPAPAVIRYPTISADGRKLAYTALTMTSNLASVRLSPDSQGPIEAPSLLTRDASERNSYPAFSPDGASVVFRRPSAGAISDAWLIGANGAGLRQLTAAPFDAGLPQWFPDGRRIAFASKRDGRSGLWSLDFETGAVAFVYQFTKDWSYWRLSPDGRTIAFNSRGAETINVWTAPVGGATAQQLTFDRESMAFPAWSPDARLIALQMKRGDDSHIGIIPASGGTAEQLTHERGQSWVGSWSPDGDKIAFAGFRDGFWNLWWVSRSTKEQKRLTGYEDLAAYVRYPTWSPRGDQIVYEYAENQGNIWLVELP